MSRSNHDKPFYVDVGTSIVAIRCASNHDVILEYDHGAAQSQNLIQMAKYICDRMNRESEICKPRRNCDVGTADEQCIRHAKWCESRADVCLVPKADKCKSCFAEWAQMPYESEAKK